MDPAQALRVIYRQAPPQLKLGGMQPLKPAVLYSGLGRGLNNPDAESEKGIGPIPRGLYKILRWETRPKFGLCVGVLEPSGHSAHGRSGFLIHGDNTTPAPNDASSGCIIADYGTRVALRTSGFKELEVI